MTGEVITQVAPPGGLNADLPNGNALPETIVLVMRGCKFTVSRERLLTLPENILFGLSTGLPSQCSEEEDYLEQDDEGPIKPSRDDGSVCGADRVSEQTDTDYPLDDCMRVDFSPNCFDYILKTLDKAEEGVEPVSILNFKAPKTSVKVDSGAAFDIDGAAGTGVSRAMDEHEEHAGFEDDNESIESLPWLPIAASEVPDVLKSRPAFIVLREYLEYYVIARPDLPVSDLWEIKEGIGTNIASDSENMHIFQGLRNSQTLNSPEYHLMQMLVLSGIPPDQRWAFRERQKNTARVLSLQLEPVKLPDPGLLENVYALQKLLLFWRKPAKKCWWDRREVEFNGEKIVVHTRRMWTLELNILGITLN